MAVSFSQLQKNVIVVVGWFFHGSKIASLWSKTAESRLTGGEF
jgi:hypothetical protein